MNATPLSPDTPDRTEVETFLATRNAHPRDAAISFFEEDHRYTIAHDPDTTYTSVTTWIHTLFPQFDSDKVIANMMRGSYWKPGHKYWGQTPEEIKALWKANGEAVSKEGTAMHAAIESFYNRYCWQFYQKQQQEQQQEGQRQRKRKPEPNPPTHADLLALYHADSQTQGGTKQGTQKTKEWQYFLQFVADHPDLIPYRTEWMVYDESLQICGSIDMLFANLEDGTLSIYDWKRSKEITRTNMQNEFSHHVELCHLPNANFWHYSLQLNMYKQLLQRQYNRRIRDLCLLRFHPTAVTYEKLEVPHLNVELQNMLQAREESVAAGTVLQDMHKEDKPSH